MAIDKEIERTVKKIADKNRHIIPISILEQEKIVSNAKNAYDSLIFNFGSITSLVLHQEGKKRLVKQYNDPYSPESILCQSIKQILDKVFKVKYPNRNKICRNLFSVLPATIQMSDFTIVKFDFQDFFNSISSIYVFEKYLRSKLLDRHDVDLIKKFVYSTKYAYAGLCTSNAIAEIIAKQFDNAVQQMFISNGIIYYERYIDDSILILNEHMEEAEVRIKLENILSNVFYDRNFNGLKCRTKYNNKKFRYICRRNILNTSCSVDFLGYEFWFSSKKMEIKMWKSRLNMVLLLLREKNTKIE